MCGGINLENIDQPADVWKPRARVFRVEDGKGVRRILPDEVCLRRCRFVGAVAGLECFFFFFLKCVLAELYPWQRDVGGSEALPVLFVLASAPNKGSACLSRA